MKNTKKALLMTLCAVMLVAASVMGTLAYLQDTSEVAKNTFTVGNVQIKLDETDVDLYGVKDGDKRVTENEYKLIPGHSYIKDPMVTVEAGSEEAYIRMIVTISDMADVKAVFGNDFLPQNFVTGWDPEVWETTGKIIETNDTAVYEFRYYKTVNTLDDKELELEPLFKTIEMPDEVENDALLTLEEMEIQVVAHAIQADGFADAEAAWGEF